MSTVSVRVARPADAAAITGIYNQGIEERVATFETELRGARDILTALDERGDRFPTVVAERDGAVVGCAWVSQYRSRACYAGIGEFSIYTDRSARGAGVGQALLSALLTECERRGFWKLAARIFPENTTSRALCRRLGFREVGLYRRHGKLDGVWRDCVIVEKLLGEAAAPPPSDELVNLLAARQGHFRLESGHHGNLWLDLELLCLWPGRIAPFAAQLAGRLSGYRIDAVCGPLVEGAFVALMVAAQLGVDFFYAERFEHPEDAGLFPVEYRIPATLRGRLRGRRVAIVNDVINAGSAVRGTLADLRSCGAETVVIGTLIVLGESAPILAQDAGVPLESVVSLPNMIWEPAACPLCTAHVPLTQPGNAIAGQP